MKRISFIKQEFIIIVVALIVILTISLIFSFKHVTTATFKKGYVTGYVYGDSIGYERGNSHGDSTGFARGFDTKYNDLIEIDKVFQDLKYSFQPSLQYSQIIGKIAEIGSNNTNKESIEFSKILNSIHTGLIDYLANNFDLNEKDKKQILAKYHQQSIEINQLAYQEMVELNESSILPKEKSIFQRRNIEGINNFDKVLAENACKIVNLFISTLDIKPYSTFFIKTISSEVCPYFLGKAIRPLIIELKRRAIIEDYAEAKYEITQQISNRIAQFATAQVQTNTSLDYSFAKQIDLHWLGKYKFTSEVKAEASAKTKAGFDFMQQFSLEIDHRLERIIIHLPEPYITSHELDLKILDIHEPWCVDIGPDQLNAINKDLRKQLLHEAEYNTTLLNDAIDSAEDILKVIFSPIATSMPYPYSVVIQFGARESKVLIDHSDMSLESFLSL
ncbi:MAG: DUF4230 domain-containing protein [Bacteroidota bacterium]